MSAEEVKIENLTVNGNVENEDVVTPWSVESTDETGIDYDKLISKFLNSYPYGKTIN